MKKSIPKQKRLPADERKKQILKCAVKNFAKSNYYNTKVADIAKEIGVSEAAIYRHFGSKKEIFLNILQHISKTIITTWKQELKETPNALDMLRKMGIDYYRRMIKHPDELKVQFLAVSGIDDKDIYKCLRKDHENYMQFIRQVMQMGIDQGEIRKDIDINAMAFLYDGGGVMMNMMHLLSFKRKFTEQTVTVLLDYFLNSIKA